VGEETDRSKKKRGKYCAPFSWRGKKKRKKFSLSRVGEGRLLKEGVFSFPVRRGEGKKTISVRTIMKGGKKKGQL